MIASVILARCGVVGEHKLCSTNQAKASVDESEHSVAPLSRLTKVFDKLSLWQYCETTGRHL